MGFPLEAREAPHRRRKARNLGQVTKSTNPDTFTHTPPPKPGERLFLCHERSHTMSKPLSDQVAELERQLQQSENLRKNLGRATHFLEAERDEFESMGNRNLEKIEELEAENTQLRRERDDARAQGISGLNRIHRHRATIRRLEEENAALRAGQGHWPEGDDSPAGEQVPRVITADELRLGQRVAVELNSGWFAGDVTGINRVISNGCESTGPAKGLTDCTIVLLADAPTTGITRLGGGRVSTGRQRLREVAKTLDWDQIIADLPPIDPNEPHHLFNPLPPGTPCPDGPHRGPQGPNEDMSQCQKCGCLSYAMRPEGEEFGGHLDDCSLPQRHQSYCQPGGDGHPPPRLMRG